MNRRDRAKQFLPFNSLRGYYDLIREKEKEVVPKRCLSDYDIELINENLLKVEKNMMVKVTFYDIDAYKTIEGIVSKIDFENNFITIVKTKISFNDISSVEVNK